MAKNKDKITLKEDSFGDIVIYSAPEEKIKVEVLLHDETLWLTQEKIAELFGVQRPAVTKHLKNIYESGELLEESTCSILEHMGNTGQSYETKYYNLDVAIAVGYRVNSARATKFRIWATSVLKDYIIKGVAMDDERLKDPQYYIGKDYFEEQLQRIREIRASERRFYQKITDIYAQCSHDYDKKSPVTLKFFATVQNKLHWAIHGHTAAEIIYQRSDANKLHMGLATWRNAPHGPIRKADVTVAKNYLSEEEIRELNRVVTMYLDYAEDMARRHKPMYMADWVKKLDAFLQFNERNILTHAGRISHQVAEERALEEFGKYDKERRRLEAVQPASDFDRFLEETRQLAGGKIKEPPEKDKALRKTTREKK